MDIFWQVLQKFQNIAVFETIFKIIFCQRVLNQNTCTGTHIQLDNIFFWKLHVYHNLNYFPKRITKGKYKFLIIHLAFLRVEMVRYVFCNLILRNHWTWTWKISDCFTRLVLTLYIGFGLESYLNYLTGLGLILWYIRVRLKKYSDCLIYCILDLDLKKTWTTLLYSNRFYYNQTGRLLEKSENLRESSFEQLVI